MPFSRARDRIRFVVKFSRGKIENDLHEPRWSSPFPDDVLATLLQSRLLRRNGRSACLFFFYLFPFSSPREYNAFETEPKQRPLNYRRLYKRFTFFNQLANVERVSPNLELGEGPHWHTPTRSLYFVDLHRGKINRYHPETNGFFSAVISMFLT